ncbi:MAG: hypothetical protein NC320_01270 [Clostridium sp.]|nr:hypothetical protein [Clostridium sp.]
MNYENVMLYKTVMSLIRELINKELITKSEYSQISTILAEKCGLSSSSIFLDIFQDIE